jgi:hypothetical protein
MVDPFLKDATAEQSATCDEGIDHMAGSRSVRVDFPGHPIVRPADAESTAISGRTAIWPRYDLLKVNRYASGALQYSRGCPFRCEFCDIIGFAQFMNRCVTHWHVYRFTSDVASRPAHTGDAR